MPEKFLVDTCVWIDFYEGREGFDGRHLGSNAMRMLIWMLNNSAVILLNEAVVRELSKRYSRDEINTMLHPFSDILGRVWASKEDVAEANSLSSQRNIPFADCLNAVQARNNNALLVSNDRHLLKELPDICKCIRPEDVS